MVRSVKFYELELKTHITKQIDGKLTNIPVKNTIKLSALANLICSMQADKDNSRKIKFIRGQGANKFYLADVLVENNKFFLLINRSDETEPDPTISKPEEDARNVLKKPEGFGNDYSAHVIIGLNPIQDSTYSLAFETARGSSIYGNHVCTFITYLLRQAIESDRSSFVTGDPEGEVDNDGVLIKRKLHLRTELLGIINDELFTDIDSGTLEEIDLIDDESKTEFFDDGKMTKQTSARITVSVESLPQSSKTLLNFISKSKKAPKEYDKLRIRFKDKSDTNQHATLDRETLMLADGHKYVKRQHIKFDGESNYGFEEIQRQIKNELAKLI